MVESCLETYGRIDILHNNVGIIEVGGCVETSEESWDRANAVNLKSMFLTCKNVLPHMSSRGTEPLSTFPPSLLSAGWECTMFPIVRPRAASTSFTRVLRCSMRRRTSAPTRSCPV